MLYFNDLPISQGVLSRLSISSPGCVEVYDHSDSHVTIIREPNELVACFFESSFSSSLCSIDRYILQASETEVVKLPKTKRLILDLLGSAEQTSTASGDETGLLSLDGVSGNGGCLSDMLVVTL